LFIVGPKDDVVISDTSRRSRQDGERVYEIVYATATTAAAATATTAAAAAAAAAAVTGLLFTTLPVGSEDGWTTGTSGYHAYSIYNYWPPAFGWCDLLFVREEL
jgi:fatty acid desaturase